jgi:hypothetical protein
MRTIVTSLLVFAALGFLFPSSAEAKRYYAGGHVVHTRLAPVVVHKIFPPYHLGIHVYARRYPVVDGSPTVDVVSQHVSGQPGKFGL